ncbi:MAG: type II secretion system protein, partial [Thermodesulfobacteriota bacterium]
MFNTVQKFKRRQQGFTLIEMAIVLVVIGLILGMVYKGRQLVASAKVKNSQAGYNKILAGMNTFYDRYGFFPGDGCGTGSSYTAGDPMSCQDGTQNGIVNTNTADDTSAFFDLMTSTEILTDADTKSALGSAWNATGDDNSTWIYVDGADLRLVCDLDRKADDGNSDDGDIRTSSDSSIFGDGTDDYNNTVDCW